MRLSHWLVKSEPTVYPWERLVREGRAVWDGVRNFEARNNLRAMKQGDLLLFYHSNEGKAVVGIARVVAEAYPEAGADGDWSVVDVEPVEPLARPVTLEEIRKIKSLSQMPLLTRTRLSVSTLTKAEFETIVRVSKTDPR